MGSNMAERTHVNTRGPIEDEGDRKGGRRVQRSKQNFGQTGSSGAVTHVAKQRLKLPGPQRAEGATQPALCDPGSSHNSEVTRNAECRGPREGVSEQVTSNSLPVSSCGHRTEEFLDLVLHMPQSP